MHIKHPQHTLAALLLIGGFTCSSYGYANTLTIDSFTDAQSVTDRGDSPGSTANTLEGLTGTDLTHASRTFTALATAGRSTYKEDIVSGYDKDSDKYLLKVSNGPHSAGTASILWNFDAIDFTQHGNAILLDVLAIDQNVNVEMVVNGTASTGIKNFSGTGNFNMDFGSFTNSNEFKNVHSLSLNFTGPAAWDGQFRILTTSAPAFTTAVPLPPAFALMGSALIGVLGFVRRKTTPISNS